MVVVRFLALAVRHVMRRVLLSSSRNSEPGSQTPFYMVQLLCVCHHTSDHWFHIFLDIQSKNVLLC